MNPIEAMDFALSGQGGAVAQAAAALVLWTAGACWASFSGLVAHRIGAAPPGGLIRAIAAPASSCEGCGKRLGLAELFPVAGWIAARGRCRSCGARVPAAYPVTEAACGFLTLAAPFAAGGLGAEPALAVLVLWTCTLASFIDVREHVIPEGITWTLLFSGLLLSPFGGDTWELAAGAATCALAMRLALAAAAWRTGQDTAAGGDVAMAAAAGAWVGMHDAALFLGLSSAVFVAYSLKARADGTEWMPMGPALSAGLVAVIALRLAT